MPTLRYALDGGASVVLASHLGRPQGARDPKYSLRPVAERLSSLLAQPVPLAPDCVGAETEALARALQPGELLLLENLRFHREEEANDDGVRAPARGARRLLRERRLRGRPPCPRLDRAITRQLQPAAAGLLMQRELEALGRILHARPVPWSPCWAAPRSPTRSSWWSTCSRTVDALAVGGGMAFTFLRALGHDVGRSLVEPDRLETARRALEAARRRSAQIVLPIDAVVADGLDSPTGRTVGYPGHPGRADGARHRSAHGRAIRGSPAQRAHDRLERPPRRVRETALRPRHAGRGAGRRRRAGVHGHRGR